MNKSFKYDLISRGLHTGFLYRLAKIGVRFSENSFREKAYLYLLEETRAAFAGDKKVVWVSTFVPSELIYALGGVPFMPEVAAGFAAAAGESDRIMNLADSDWLSQDLCSIHRAGIGLVKSDFVPEPDLIIAASHLCDGAKKYLQYLSKEFDCPYYLLETPYSLKDEDRLARQLQEVALDITSNPDFSRVFEYSNRAYQYHEQINKIREQIPACFSGERSMNMIPMEFMSFGTKRGVEYYRELLQELKRRQQRQQPVVEGEKHRLLWLHLKPYYAQNIFDKLREKKAVVAFEEYFQLYWEPLAVDKPYLSLARKMINHFGWGPLSQQIERIIDIINTYKIDGVIGFSQWGCRQNSGRLDAFKYELKQQNIPFLKIDGDLVDDRDYREGQLMTRLEAFIELIEQQDLNSESGVFAGGAV